MQRPKESDNGSLGTTGTTEKYQIPEPSMPLTIGGVAAFIAGVLVLMAFSSPYWLVSWEGTSSPFVRMGLWEFCFNRFRYPAYQFDKVFTGCHYVFGQKFLIIREWILPGWLMVVQSFVTLALIFSFTSLVIIACEVTRWPLHFVLRYEWLLSTLAAGFNAISGGFLFLGVAVFGGQCWRRDWLMYPNFNYLSWSFAFAVIAFFIFFAAAGLLLMAAKNSWENKQESRNLVMQMQQQSHHGSASRMYHPSAYGYM